MDTEEKAGDLDPKSELSQESTSDHTVLFSNIDPEVEKRLVRKIDIFIVPPIMLLYLFSFLDRYVFETRVAFAGFANAP